MSIKGTPSNELQWQQHFIEDTKYILDTHRGSMSEYINVQGMWELVSTTNEWRCVRDIFPHIRYSPIYK